MSDSCKCGHCGDDRHSVKVDSLVHKREWEGLGKPANQQNQKPRYILVVLCMVVLCMVHAVLKDLLVLVMCCISLRLS